MTVDRRTAHLRAPELRGRGWLNRWNARHPWSHNDHFHGWILSNLPARRATALDVGCGRGELVFRLALCFGAVTGVDPDAEMAEASQGRFAGDARVVIRRESLLETSGRYDLVTFVASLHHLPLDQALAQAARLVAVGGRLLVVGLARAETPGDIALDLSSLALNPLVGLLKHPRAVHGGPRPPSTPVRDAEQSFGEIHAVATRLLPGARLRRRLFFRYTLRWDNPQN